jgi:hypothetical protein
MFKNSIYNVRAINTIIIVLIVIIIPALHGG